MSWDDVLQVAEINVCNCIEVGKTYWGAMAVAWSEYSDSMKYVHNHK